MSCVATKVELHRPYVKGLPITATILSSKPNGDHSEEVIRPTYEDAYTLEYKAMYAAITEGAPVKTTAADGEAIAPEPKRVLTTL